MKRKEKQLIAYFDSGTTNTRLYLLDLGFNTVFSEVKDFGSKDCALCGSNRPLISGMKSLYARGLHACGRQDTDVSAIYASGMVTSPYGLREVEHLLLPIDISTFAHSFYPYYEGTHFHRKIHLIPGICTKNPDFAFVNNMRGEEIEVIGALEELRQAVGKRSAAVILPGSHTHIAYIEDSQIKGLLSTFTGELFHALKTSTILSPVLDRQNQELDESMVKRGCRCLEQFGFNRAVYMAHAMRIFGHAGENERFSFGEGVINGGVRQALEYYCRNFWKGCRTAVVIGEPFMYRLYASIFDESPMIEETVALPINKKNPFTVKGLERLVKSGGICYE